MKIPEIPKSDCKGCNARDELIRKLAKRIDDLEASDLERSNIYPIDQHREAVNGRTRA